MTSRTRTETTKTKTKTKKESLQVLAIQQAKSFHTRPNKVVTWFKRHKKSAIVLAISTALVVGSAMYAMTRSIKDTKETVQDIVGSSGLIGNGTTTTTTTNTTMTNTNTSDNEVIAQTLMSTIKNNSTNILTSEMPFKTSYFQRVLKGIYGIRQGPTKLVQKKLKETVDDILSDAKRGTLDVKVARQQLSNLRRMYPENAGAQRHIEALQSYVNSYSRMLHR
jgi:hypothetical protein